MTTRYVFTPTRVWAVLQFVAFMEADGTLRFIRFPDCAGAKRVARTSKRAIRRARRPGE